MLAEEGATGRAVAQARKWVKLTCLLMSLSRGIDGAPEGAAGGERIGHRVLTSVPTAVIDAHKAYKHGERVTWAGFTSAALRSDAAHNGDDVGGSITSPSPASRTGSTSATAPTTQPTRSCCCHP